MRRSPFGLGIALVGVAACFGVACKDSAGTATNGAPVTLAPVPEPASLLAEVYIPAPGTFWTKARTLVAGPAMLLPASFPIAVTGALGLPPAAAESIDNDLPAFGAVAGTVGEEKPVLALHVRSGESLIAKLTVGPDAGWLARKDEPSGVTLLEPKPGRTTLTASLGVTGNYLLLGVAPDGLLRVGPYVARTLPTKKAPGEDLSITLRHEALASVLRGRLEQAWGKLRTELEQKDKEAREAHGGSAPTFGDPVAAIGKANELVETISAAAATLREARVALVLDEAGAHLRGTFSPEPDGAAKTEIASLVSGPATPILALPGDTNLAVLVRDDAKKREEKAASQADTVDRILGHKLGDPGKKKVSDLLAAWAKGRGDWLTVGLAPGGHHAIYGHSAIADAAGLDQSLRGMIAATSIPAIRDPLASYLGDLKIGAPSSLPGGATLVHAERKPKETAKDVKPLPIEVAWRIPTEADGVATYVLSNDGKAALEAATSPTDTLADDPEVKAAVDRLENEASFAVVAMPSRLFVSIALKGKVPKPPPASPVVFAIGRSGDDAVVRVDAATVAVREIAKIKVSDAGK